MNPTLSSLEKLGILPSPMQKDFAQLKDISLLRQRQYLEGVALPTANTVEEYCNKVRPYLSRIPQMLKDGLTIREIHTLFIDYFFQSDEQDIHDFFGPARNPDHKISASSRARMSLSLDIYAHQFNSLHALLYKTPIVLNCLLHQEEALLRQIAGFYFNKSSHMKEWMSLFEEPNAFLLTKENEKYLINYLYYPFFMKIFLENTEDAKGNAIPFFKKGNQNAAIPAGIFTYLIMNPENAVYFPTYFKEIQKNHKWMQFTAAAFHETDLIYDTFVMTPKDIQEACPNMPPKDLTPVMKALLAQTRTYHWEEPWGRLFLKFYQDGQLEKIIAPLTKDEKEIFYDAMMFQPETIDALVEMDKKGLCDSCKFIEKMIKVSQNPILLPTISKHFGTHFSSNDVSAMIPKLSEKDLENLYGIMRGTPQALEGLMTFVKEKTADGRAQESLLFYYYRKHIMPPEDMINTFHKLSDSFYKVFLLSSKYDWPPHPQVEDVFFKEFGNDDQFVENFITSFRQKEQRQAFVTRNLANVLNAFQRSAQTLRSIVDANDLIRYWVKSGDKNSFVMLKDSGLIPKDTLYVAFFQPDDNGNTPLHLLFEKGHKSFLNMLAGDAKEYLIDACEMIYQMENNDKKIPLELASPLFLRWVQTKIEILSPFITDFQQTYSKKGKKEFKRVLSPQNEPVCKEMNAPEIKKEQTQRPYFELPSFQRAVAGYPKELQDQVKEAQEFLCSTPDLGSTLFKDKKPGFYTTIFAHKINYNGNKYRIFYTLQKNGILFLRFNPRENTYTKTSRRRIAKQADAARICVQTQQDFQKST